MKLKVGMMAPDFTLPSHLGSNVTLSDFRGKNVVLAFFPLAWTPVWTAQIPSYEAEKAKFEGLNTQVLGISVDSTASLKAWADSFNGISYPLLSDFYPHGAVADLYGVLRPEGFSERALFVIDRYGIIQYIDIHDIDLQPDNEVLREEIRRIDPIAAAREPKEEKPAPAPLPKGGIVLYCTTWCPDCRRARLWLKEHGLPYTEVDIYAVPGAAEQVMKWTGGVKTTPTFDIDDTIIIKFDEARLREVLKDRLKA